jgi:transposase InsO family protein
MSENNARVQGPGPEGDLPGGEVGHPDGGAERLPPELEDDIILVDDEPAPDRPSHPDDEDDSAPAAVPIPGPRSPRPTARRRGRRTVKAEEAERRHFAPEQRMLILSAWQRSGLSAKDFAPLVGVRQPTLYSWKKLFEEHGPAGLEKKPKKGGPGGRLPEATKQAILMMKEAHPNWGADRLHDMLLRSEGHTASPRVIQRLLVANGYQVVEEQTHKHPPKVRRFEAAAPNALWQTDLFTFLLKRQNRRVHLVAFMDDHSRFITGFGLHATASGALVREVFERAAANFGSPRACLTDNGTQYKTWRGKSAFTKLCEKRGIEHIVASPRRPQTLGKIERFWKTLWDECVEEAIFLDHDDARVRIGHFFDWCNFFRTHQSLDGLVPADRYFAADQQVRETMSARVAANALELAKHGAPRKPFYLTGRVGDQAISLHGEDERVVLTKEDGTREEVDLRASGRRAGDGDSAAMPEPVADGRVEIPDRPEPERDVPGTSPMDAVIDELDRVFDPDGRSAP